MTAPHIPLSPTDLAALPAHVAAAWPDAARQAGFPDNCNAAEVRSDGSLHAIFAGRHAPGGDALAERALRILADSLVWEHGYAVEAGRVVGWAAVQAQPGDGMVVVTPWGRLIRIRDIPPSDPRREAHDTAALRARTAAGSPPGPGALSKGEMARRRAGGR